MSLTALHLWAPGINCQRELGIACEMVGMDVQICHIQELLANPALIHGADFLGLPGGFSYGDDIASGKILANQVRQLTPELERFIAEGKLIFGVCNGFQVLTKAGLLPGAPHPRGSATLSWNDSGRFECRWARVHPNPQAPGPWTKNLPLTLRLPLAHAEGKFVASKAVLDDLTAHQQIAFTYANHDGSPALAYPVLPSGSLRAIAGITDRTGQILGMMPHPERHTLPTQAPDWTRLGLGAEPTCLGIFENAAAFLSSRVPVGA